MLEIKNIKKSYRTGDFVQQALDNVSLKFRNHEFVAILGPSGSGKTTLLNILGGLDRYDSGDLIINGKSTKKFTDAYWDAYRNNCIGFIFQSYNLITHISVLANVEMSLTLSGISKKERRNKAIEALTKVGLKDHIHKKPNQLSGGQMQRVAIARSLVNNPDIILADEPTGALDSKTSIQIMELIKEISKEKLVIMVTHNEELAKNYASRIVNMKDGKIISDSDEVEKNAISKEYKIRKTKMSFLSALNLSFNNIKTKKGRTFLTALASSIGIIGIALILSLSNGFDIKINEFEQDSLSNMPIIIAEQGISLDEETISAMQEEISNESNYPSNEIISAYQLEETIPVHVNNITNEYYEYIKNIDESLIAGITYGYYTNLNLLVKNNNKVMPLNISNSFIPLPIKDGSYNEYLESNYDLLKGSYPTKSNEILLVVDMKNRIPSNLLTSLGFEDEVSFDEILNKEIKLVFNDDYYQKIGNYFTINENLDEIYNNENNVTLTISGIVRGKEDKEVLVGNTSGLSYRDDLIDKIINKNTHSEIVKAQQASDFNVLTGEKFDLSKDEDIEKKEQLLNYFGQSKTPAYFYIYPKDFASKENITSYLDKYNENKSDEDKIIYIDQSEILTTLSGSIMDAITIVLIAFSGISLVVSSIMIGIITYISVLERTKEIGILRAIGARKKDITRVFNAETFIIGLSSGLLGILIAYLLTIPVNNIIYKLTDLKGVAILNPIHALILITVSIILTLIGGAIPAKIASKKDPVEALRTE